MHRSYIYFHLDDCELCQQYKFSSQELMGADMPFRISLAGRNFNQSLRNGL